MTAATLIESLTARGFSFLANGESLIVSPASVLTDEDRQAIRDHKAELLTLLAGLSPETDEKTEMHGLAIVTESAGVEHCPTCGRELEWCRGKYYLHVWCPRPGHHLDAWRADGGRKLKETDAPIIRERGRG